MDIIDLSFLARNSSNTIIFDILGRNQKRPAEYATLIRTRDWPKLAEACRADIFAITGDIAALIEASRHNAAAVRNRRGVKNDIVTALGRVDLKPLKSALEKREKSASGSRAAPFAKQILRCLAVGQKDSREKLIACVNDAMPAGGQGLMLRTAAHYSLAGLSLSLQCLARAETNMRRDARLALPKAAVTAAGDATAARTLAMLAGYRERLYGLQKRIYGAALGDRARLNAALLESIAWIAQNFGDLLALQSAISTLSDVWKKDLASQSGLALQAIDVAYAARGAAASCLSSIIMLLDNEGMRLRGDATRMVAAASGTAFDRNIHSGKRTTIGGIKRLPDGMFVNILARATKIATTGRGKKRLFQATIRDFDGAAAMTVTAPCDPDTLGIATGGAIRLSGTYRKKGSARLKQAHIAIEKMKIREVYSRDIWKIRFLDLASPYFSVWPCGHHVIGEPRPRPADAGGLLRGTLASPCDALKAKYQSAQQSYYEAQAAYSLAMFELSALAIDAAGTCGDPETIWLCPSAIAKVIAGIQAELAAADAMKDAYQDFLAAYRAWLDCTLPPNPTAMGWTGWMGTLADLDLDDGDDGGGTVTPPPPPPNPSPIPSPSPSPIHSPLNA